MKKFTLYISLLLLITCSKDSTEDNASVYVAPPTNTTNPTTTPSVTQYTLTVTAGNGGSVSTAGGTYNDGTSISITATPNEGYGFIGWNGSDSTSSTISVTLTANTTIEALFGQLPQLTLPETPSKMFTKGVGDTLSIGFSHAGGYKSTSLSAEYGSVSVISEPNEGDAEGNIVIEYTVNSVENVDRMTTIAGFDDIEISISGNDDLTNSATYQIRSQPEPVYRNYNLPSNETSNVKTNVNPPLVRFLNEKDNSMTDRCQYINGGLNKFGNIIDDYAGIAYADVNGDGYDDMFIHPVYTDGGAGGFSQIKNEYELYLYTNGEYIFHEINWRGNDIPSVHLARKILVGDFDNDGDPDFYSANFGIDGGSYDTEPSLFIINNFSEDLTLSYKENTHIKGVHEASSADIDNDGDLDIFSIPRESISDPPAVFFKNNGNFELENWAGYEYNGYTNIVFGENSIDDDPQWQRQYFSRGGFYHSEIYDINKDGYLDLIIGGHEWENDFRILWGSYDGFNTNNISLIPKVNSTELAYDMGILTDIKILDFDNDGINEIFLMRTGGDFEYGESSYYAGWYLQILKVSESNQLNDITNTLIDDYYSDDLENFCGNPYNNWIFWIVVNDYDNDGNLDIYNRMLSNRPLHRWEWNGSKFSKVD